ncbi:hypothetical protein DUZ99_03975 [Xylanibacillus composti]|uniref:Uncharacterized protein n=1 Tax=Xylanibacillus composti TaxID=1572762 RepID=A0A8J4H4S7_9BACL|nr:hypothetical protein [Xylanibacillus composti]MDT9724144.1 hypothetical protein [Xylanibacillus composti]GIQ68693.1 hypothetical protein XYCOK13_15170 [Xylanibacillus composti]
MQPKTRVILAVAGSFIVCVYGLFRLVTEIPFESVPILPIVFAVTGFIGIIGNLAQWRKLKNG